MPYYLQTDDRQAIKDYLKRERCAECGGTLEAFYDIQKHLPYLQCKNNPEHEGIGKPNKKEDNSYKGGVNQMIQVEREHGVGKARQLVKYQGGTSLTRSQAMEIMEIIWPDAPVTDKMAAAMLCESYGLNPLANHVFLVPYKDKETGEVTWARIWGIRAKRLVASRRGGYSYLDMTPRLMTDEEQVKVWGEVDQVNLSYLTHLKDMKTGAESYGYGKWPKNTQPKGTGKGNTQANMASIRSESQALDRLRPAEMPSGFTVADEQYIEGEVRVVDETTDEVTEQPAKTELIVQSPPEASGKAEKPATEIKSGTDTTKKVEGSETIDLLTLDFKNPGEFYTACLKHFKLQKSIVDKEIPEYDVANAGQRKKAWQQIVGVYQRVMPERV